VVGSGPVWALLPLVIAAPAAPDTGGGTAGSGSSRSHLMDFAKHPVGYGLKRGEDSASLDHLVGESEQHWRN